MASVRRCSSKRSLVREKGVPRSSLRRVSPLPITLRLVQVTTLFSGTLFPLRASLRSLVAGQPVRAL